MKSAEKKLPTMEPRISQSVKPKRSTTKTEDPARMKTTDELLRQVINEAKAFCRPATLKSGSKKLETFNARRWLVRGRVQGVGYRWFAQKSAAGLGLSGYARNLDDERVEVYAAGTEAKLAELAGLLYRGPRWADVRGVEEQECAVQELGSFRIEA